MVDGQVVPAAGHLEGVPPSCEERGATNFAQRRKDAKGREAAGWRMAGAWRPGRSWAAAPSPLHRVGFSGEELGRQLVSRRVAEAQRKVGGRGVADGQVVPGALHLERVPPSCEERGATNFTQRRKDAKGREAAGWRMAGTWRPGRSGRLPLLRFTESASRARSSEGNWFLAESQRRRGRWVAAGWWMARSCLLLATSKVCLPRVKNEGQLISRKDAKTQVRPGTAGPRGRSDAVATETWKRCLVGANPTRSKPSPAGR